MWIITKFFSDSSKKEFVELGSYSMNALNSLFWGKSKMDNLTHEELFSLYKGIVFWACDAIGDWMAWLDRSLFKDERMLEESSDKRIKLVDAEMIKAIAIFLKTVWVVYIFKDWFWKRVDSLHLLKTWGVTPMKVNWKVSYYQYFDWHSLYRFEKEEILVLKSFSPLFHDNWMTPLKAVASQVATDLASVEFNRLFFENGGKPGTILKHSQKIKEEVRDKYLSNFKKDYMGLNNSHKIAFMDQWIEVETLSVNQKDMEMTAQRQFTIDEVLMIFRVPKPILWKSDWVWFADRGVPGYYFTEYCLKPLALQIEENLNKTIFDWVWYFSFVFMQDKDELLKEYQANTISLNEYRLWTWRTRLEWGDVLWDWTPAKVENSKKRASSEEMSSLEQKLFWAMKEAENVDVFWTEQYNQKIWTQKIKRTDEYEVELAKLQKRIWNAQEKEILENLSKEKWMKKIEKEEDVFDKKKYNLMYIALMSKFFKDLLSKEWTIALEEISEETFAIAKLNKWIWENIDRMSKDIDSTTRLEMFEIIKQGNRDKVWVATISANIRAKFSQYTRKSWRVENVVRTEITRASNKAQQSAYEQSWVVVKKQWYTAIDERRCEYCADLHWKTIKLNESFLKLWDKHLWQKIEYETVEFPPRHPRCRCTERPIVERKHFQKMKEVLLKKWVTLYSKFMENEQ